ncbi:hypothetical protein AAC387_Pa03g3201 [Persea americana]
MGRLHQVLQWRQTKVLQLCPWIRTDMISTLAVCELAAFLWNSDLRGSTYLGVSSGTWGKPSTTFLLVIA